MVEGLPFMFLLVSHLFVSGVTSKTITIENQCNYNVWPGIQTSTTVPLSTGFLLKTGKKRVINVPPSWQGRFWGRSHCSTNSTGQFGRSRLLQPKPRGRLQPWVERGPTRWTVWRDMRRHQLRYRLSRRDVSEGA
ncbi:PR5-like receptor kinase [Cardamine amara subsp. amara]|uniref:PR5-like receptor kinase n=1 Tax=Cardamine amara subsp. amara TaxID=228776 RepID=A0ABD0ZBP0_CARAN